MNGPALDPRFAAALRSELQHEIARSASHSSSPYGRASAAAVLGAAAVAVAMVLVIVSIVSAQAPSEPPAPTSIDPSTTTATAPTETDAITEEPLQPGATRVAELGRDLSGTVTGTLEIDLGPAPPGATHAGIGIVCLSSGLWEYPDGSSERCTTDDDESDTASLPTITLNRLPLSRTETTYRIEVTEGSQWRYRAVYLRAVITDWKTNAAGQSYGAMNTRGMPDLVAVVATNGRHGYVTRRDFNGPGLPQSPGEAVDYMARLEEQGPIVVPVYESDGITVIGEYRFG